MLEFKVIENLKPNKDLTDILKEFKYKVKLGQTKTTLHTNLTSSNTYWIPDYISYYSYNTWIQN